MARAMRVLFPKSIVRSDLAGRAVDLAWELEERWSPSGSTPGRILEVRNSGDLLLETESPTFFARGDELVESHRALFRSIDSLQEGRRSAGHLFHPEFSSDVSIKASVDVHPQDIAPA